MGKFVSEASGNKSAAKTSLETIPNFNPQFFLSLNLLLLPHPQGRPQAGVGGCG